MVACVGGLAAGVVLTWRLSERHQWTGPAPYVITTLLILALLVPMTVIAHWLWTFPMKNGLLWVIGMSAFGVVLRGASTSWAEPYWRRR